MGLDGFASKPQELTLSYLCENPKLGFNQKGKEVIFSENSNQEERWVERDFMNLEETKSNSSSKREVHEDEDNERENSSREKKPKLESTLNLSLALPDVSLSLTASNALQNAEPVIKPKPSRSIQSLGTNGSVHSRFRPNGDGLVALNNNNHGGGGNGGFSMMQGHRVTNKDSCNNSLYRTTSSDNLSFFPSELPAWPRLEAYSGDSRRRDSENMIAVAGVDGGGKARKLSRPEKILHEIVWESIPVMAQIIQELAEETLASTKEYLKNLVAMPEKKEELVGLQNRLERRSDLSKEALLKCQKDQLEILVAVRMGLGSFISGKVRVPANELVEIFLYMRCRNVNCKSILPVDDCDCKFCSANKGFCSSCMCPVCMNFDCANNTCSWVGCDVVPIGVMLPVDVFVCCAKDWGLETLTKELDCVRKIFKGSDDFKGKELHIKAEALLSKLESKILSPSDACNIIIQFFNYADGISDFPASGVSAKELMPTEFGKLSKKDGLGSLESIVRIKEAEARMFQSKADEARRDAESYLQMIRARSEKLEEEYAEKLAKLCLQETEERRRKKLEDLKSLENSHCDYYNMKLRMQAEIAEINMQCVTCLHLHQPLT
ncbi:hypothetical protein GH714_042017 [Hevea brasiliensis]|uniref:Uncharacterized protein n=1 Tax=Hevea brasiliensis TaxID=3981 RepID=A0A6A6MWI2_HEVBR|nr:hypothetical protein GH714_042017 [Hevea brasiliensis]